MAQRLRCSFSYGDWVLDIHDTFFKLLEYLIDKVNENKSLRGKTFVSHCFVLGKLDKTEQEDMAKKLAAAEIGIISTIPFGAKMMPISVLMKHGEQ